ncbi:MAG: diguanylate cyclase [Lachnospiraceae bacterium]|jgi:diguanylate cyclase (GGDEF)-like protein|nr:diguanylate cyclase [Lachnospiraceae bacterium]MEE3461519.1 diguanylate cyclase [Lachnospiraceae bacterium]
MADRLKEFYRARKTLEDKIFFVVLVVGIAASFISTLVTFFEDMGKFAWIVSLICGLLAIFFLILAYSFHKENLSRIVTCILFNMVMMPVLYFQCGGINGGMMLYFMLTLFTIVPLLKGMPRVIVVCLSMISFISTVMAGYLHPELIHGMDNMQARIIDVICSYVLAGLAIVTMSAMIVRAYAKQKKDTEELMDEIKDMAVHDQLTGLYNRRKLFDALESDEYIENKEDYYMTMFDVDNFRSINDTYGHVAGDKVLERVAGEILKEEKAGEGDIAVRFGGEEFALLSRKGSFTEAVDTAEVIRKNVQAMNWDEMKGVHVTISGGVVPCSRFEKSEEIITNVDSLMYYAKHTGKNKIVSKIEG